MSIKGLVLAFLLLPMLAACFVSTGGNLFAAEANRVHNANLGTNYASIQAAIDDPKTVDGHTVLVDEGVYSENVVIHKSIFLVGRDREKTQIDGGIAGGAIPVQLTANGSSLVNFTITGGRPVGIFVDRTNDSVIANNTVTGAEDYAIYASYTGNCRIDGNIAALNLRHGILVTNSHDFVAINNKAFSNPNYGLNANDSSSGLISQNLVFDNKFDGIGLGMGTTRCTVCKNTVENNTLGIWVEYDSTANTIYQNNIVGNRIQAIAGYTNSWDNGLEGNFWGDYLGSDANFDGIDDDAHEIDVNNTDRYPLLGRFCSYESFRGRPVEIVSNSSISDFTFFTHNLTMKIEIDPVEDQGYGFCRINIPHKLMVEPYNVAVTNSQPVSFNVTTLYDDGYSRWIYLSYNQSTGEIVIQGHVPPDTDPPVISILSPQNATYHTSSMPLEFVVDEELHWGGYSLDTQQNVTVSGNTTLMTLSNGAHVLVLYAEDVAGNTGRSEIAFFIEVLEERSVTWIIAVAVVVATICVVLLLYLRKGGRLKR
jgi:parallel beta-helix repeat protein